MTIWAIADLHLSFGVPGKSMEKFGPAWKDFTGKTEENWRELISDDDLVLIAGDISWAMKLEEAAPDLAWIDKLPGKKIIIKGNHDYWWPSNAKLRKALPPSIDFIQGNALSWNGVSIGGARMWDTPEYNFSEHIDFIPNDSAREKEANPEEDARIFERDLLRMERSLELFDPNAEVKIALSHYPPIGPEMKESRLSRLFEKYGVTHVIFGHLHNLKKESKLFGEKNGIQYICTSADYIDFKPVKVI